MLILSVFDKASSLSYLSCSHKSCKERNNYINCDIDGSIKPESSSSGSSKSQDSESLDFFILRETNV